MNQEQEAPYFHFTMSNISEVKALNQKLLKAVSTGDWETYQSLCAVDISCFEPETAGQVVEGLSELRKCAGESRHIETILTFSHHYNI